VMPASPGSTAPTTEPTRLSRGSSAAVVPHLAQEAQQAGQDRARSSASDGPIGSTIRRTRSWAASFRDDAARTVSPAVRATSVLGGPMSKRAAVLCGVAVVMAGGLAAVPAEAGTPRAVEPFHAAKPTWKKCGTEDYPTLQCASVKVPLDHSDPAGRTITLALSRVPHTAKKYQGPLLVNPGGPGGSGLTLAGFVAASLPKKVAAQYDVIGFDPRGVGSSEPALNCAPDHFGPVRPDPVPTSPEVERAGLERAKSFAEACGRKYGDLLPHINTNATVRDMEVIRQALG